MSEESHNKERTPSKPERPSWELPGSLEVIALVAFGVVGIVGTVISGDQDAHILLQSLFWVLGSVPLLLILCWVVVKLWQEWVVAGTRLRFYDCVLDRLEQYSTDLTDEREKNQDLTRKLIGLLWARKPEDLIIFDLSSATIRGSNLLIAVNGSGVDILEGGDSLVVFDPEFGDLVGYLNVTQERTLSGACLADPIDWNPVTLGFVRAEALRDKNLPLRAKAIYLERHYERTRS